MEKVIRWGILGNAMIARDFMIPAMKKGSICKVAAIASRTELSADFLPDCKHYASYDELLADPEIDAIYVPVPNSLHAKWSIKAMEQGKHVLCEKPICCTSAEFQMMRDAAEKNGVLLMEAFMYRYGEKFQKLLEIVKSGVLGKITSMQGVHGYPLTWTSPAREDPALGGGSLYDVGCYVVDCMNAVMELEGQSLVSVGGTALLQGGVDWNAACWLRYGDGTLGTLQCWFNAEQAQHVLLVGEKGTLLVPMLFEPGEGTLCLTVNGKTQEIHAEGSDCYQQEAEAFSLAILGEKPMLISHDETANNISALEQLYTRLLCEIKK